MIKHHRIPIVFVQKILKGYAPVFVTTFIDSFCRDFIKEDGASCESLKSSGVHALDPTHPV